MALRGAVRSRWWRFLKLPQGSCLIRPEEAAFRSSSVGQCICEGSLLSRSKGPLLHRWNPSLLAVTAASSARPTLIWYGSPTSMTQLHNICTSALATTSRAAEPPHFFRHQLRYYNPSEIRRLEIASKASRMQAKRFWSLILGGTAISGFIILLLNTFQENLMFYITPTQALEKFREQPSKNRFRLGGLVLEGSVKHFRNSTEMEFVLTDLANEILVRYRGALPDLFREGHSIVAEGFLKPIPAGGMIVPGGDVLIGIGGGYREDEIASTDLGERAKEDCGCYFAASEVLAKHDEKYMPKEVAAAVAKNREANEAAAAAAAAKLGLSGSEDPQRGLQEDALGVPVGSSVSVSSPRSSPEKDSKFSNGTKSEGMRPPPQSGRVAQAPAQPQGYELRLPVSLQIESEREN